MLDELERRGSELDADPDVRVIVNTGDGAAFQTGLDVVQLADGPGGAARAVPPRPSAPSCASRRGTTRSWKPVIAAVNGMCAAAACTSSPTPTS